MEPLPRQLTPSAAQAFALVTHELATNASKHRALSKATGLRNTAGPSVFLYMGREILEPLVIAALLGFILRRRKLRCFRGPSRSSESIGQLWSVIPGGQWCAWNVGQEGASPRQRISFQPFAGISADFSARRPLRPDKLSPTPSSVSCSGPFVRPNRTRLTPTRAAISARPSAITMPLANWITPRRREPANQRQV
jgi:hypothetical protein